MNKIGTYLKANAPAIKGAAIDVTKMVVSMAITMLVVTAVVAVGTVLLAAADGYVQSKLNPEQFAADLAAEQAEI